MHKLMPRAALAAGVVAAFLALPGAGRAQTTMHWGFDAGRASRPGAYVPYDGEPFSTRYNYPEPPLFLWGTYGRQWYTQYELDREERFEKFGTRYGPDHPPLFNRLLDKRRR